MITYVVKEDESDLFITSEKDLSKEIAGCLHRSRSILTSFIKAHPEFRSALTPLKLESDDDFIMLMLETAQLADVGPMAAVAGAVNEYIGNKIADDLIIENGGDIFIRGGVIMQTVSAEELFFRSSKQFRFRCNADPSAFLSRAVSSGWAQSAR